MSHIHLSGGSLIKQKPAGRILVRRVVPCFLSTMPFIDKNLHNRRTGIPE